MLIRNFYLKDIRNYENNTGNNILEFFNTLNLNNIIELISIGNNNCTHKVAGDILDNYLEIEGNTLLSALLEIKEQLIGVGDNDSNEVDEKDKIDITSYNSLTDLYTQFSMQLLSVGLSYSEFWSMTTKEMYMVFNSIAIKIQNETNSELNNYHTLAAMIGSAVWGKLQKEPPRIDIVKKVNEDNDSDVDTEVLMINAKLKSLVNMHNKNIKEKGE